MILRLRYCEIRPANIGGKSKWIRTWGRDYTKKTPPSITTLLRVVRRNTAPEANGAMRSIYRRPEEPTDERPLVTDYRRDFILLQILWGYYKELGGIATDYHEGIQRAASGMRLNHGAPGLIDVVQQFENTAAAGDIFAAGAIRSFLAPHVRPQGRGRPRRRIDHE
jgi:hypothetical protein